MCGEAVARGASACRHCGASHDTGWNEEATDYDGLDLPEEPSDFSYDEFMAREFGQGRRALFNGLKPIWWGTAVLLFIALFYLWVR